MTVQNKKINFESFKKYFLVLKKPLRLILLIVFELIPKLKMIYQIKLWIINRELRIIMWVWKLIFM